MAEAYPESVPARYSHGVSIAPVLCIGWTSKNTSAAISVQSLQRFHADEQVILL